MLETWTYGQRLSLCWRRQEDQDLLLLWEAGSPSKKMFHIQGRTGEGDMWPADVKLGCSTTTGRVVEKGVTSSVRPDNDNLECLVGYATTPEVKMVGIPVSGMSDEHLSPKVSSKNI